MPLLVRSPHVKAKMGGAFAGTSSTGARMCGSPLVVILMMITTCHPQCCPQPSSFTDSSHDRRRRRPRDLRPQHPGRLVAILFGRSRGSAGHQGHSFCFWSTLRADVRCRGQHDSGWPPYLLTYSYLLTTCTLTTSTRTSML